MLNLTQVSNIINNPAPDYIKWARDYHSKMLVHVEGVGLQEYLSRINGYENIDQYKARQKHAISNKFIVEELLRPVDNAFNARGGSKNYRFSTQNQKKEKELAKILSGIKNNNSLSEYIEKIWFNKFIVDPNGLIFMEIQEDDNNNESILTPTYKSINSIRDYKQRGVNVDWVVFEPHIIEEQDESKIEIFWAVDEAYYYLYKKEGEDVLLLNQIDNTFEQVPAVICSNIQDSLTEMKKSAIDAQVELLDKYVVSNSVLSITEFLHCYPQMWAYVGNCKQCNGSGHVTTMNGRREKCSSCDGTGKDSRKDCTDIIELVVPDETQQKIAPDVAGYIEAPIESWELMTSSVDRYWDIIYFSQWGTTVSKNAKNETATGRFLDSQPVNNRLNHYSKSIELIHTKLANFIGQFYFPETFEGAIIQYGRRYLIETPDQIWEKYISAKEKLAPVSTLDLLLNQFIESEFKENETQFIIETKKIKIEPFVHWDIETVQNLGVNDIDYYKKLYYNEWLSNISDDYIFENDIQTLNNSLTEYVSIKMTAGSSLN